MRGIAPAADRLRGAVGLAYAPASQTSEATGYVCDSFTGSGAANPRTFEPSNPRTLVFFVSRERSPVLN